VKVAALLCLLVAPAARAQHVRLGVDGTTITYAESDSGRSATGRGAGGRLELSLGRWALDARTYRASLEPETQGPTPFDVTQVDLRIRYRVASLLALEVGGGRRYVRPTFAAGRSVEAHLLDFDGNLYDRTLSLAVVARIRGEIRFDGVEALKAQIGRDVAAARTILEGGAWTDGTSRT